MNRHMHLGLMFVTRAVAARVAALMESMVSLGLYVRVVERDVKEDHFLAGTTTCWWSAGTGTRCSPSTR